jgi:nucleoid DNA-binding protein
MNNYEFVKFAANRFGIDETVAESMVDMFAQTLQELVASGQSVTIYEIGEFKSVPLFPNGLNHHNNIALAKVAKRNIVSFKASENLTKVIA